MRREQRSRFSQHVQVKEDNFIFKRQQNISSAELLAYRVSDGAKRVHSARILGEGDLSLLRVLRVQNEDVVLIGEEHRH